MEKAAAIAVLVALASVGLSSPKVYTVGDEAGWAIPANTNYYTVWAFAKHFQIGDVLRFVYNTTYHSVMIVMREDYRACYTGRPARSFRSGDESLGLLTAGDYYFICGDRDHCIRGMKFWAFVYGPGRAK